MLTDVGEPVRVTTTADSDRRRRWWQGVKSRAIKNLGGVCAQCAIDDPRVLQLDHIEPVCIAGRSHRATRSEGYSQKREWQRAAKGDLENLQLLCANCHVLKTRIELEVISCPNS